MSFLANYITKENPEIEEVLLDGELFSEIKSDNKITANYIIRHFDKVLNYITVEPDVNCNSKISLNLPFVVSEVLCLNMKEIQSKLMNLSFNKKKENDCLSSNNVCKSNSNNFPDTINSAPVLPDFFRKFFSYVEKTDSEVIVASTLPGYCFKVMKKIIKSNFKEFLRVFSVEENYNQLITCLQNTIYLDSSADILILLYANEIEQYSEFKKNLTKQFVSILSKNLSQINGLLKDNLSEYKKLGKIDFKTSLIFDSIENILKYFMKQMKVMTLIETNKNTRDSIIIDIIFNNEYLENLKNHLILISEN